MLKSKLTCKDCAYFCTEKRLDGFSYCAMKNLYTEAKPNATACEMFVAYDKEKKCIGGIE